MPTPDCFLIVLGLSVCFLRTTFSFDEANTRICARVLATALHQELHASPPPFPRSAPATNALAEQRQHTTR